MKMSEEWGAKAIKSKEINGRMKFHLIYLLCGGVGVKTRAVMLLSTILS